MNIDINLVNSLKVGEFIKISETEVLACVVCEDCEGCYYHYTDMDCVKCQAHERDDEEEVKFVFLTLH